MRSTRPAFFVPLVFIIIGAILLLKNFLLISLDTSFLIPLVIILAGIQLLFRGDLGVSWQTQNFGITRGAVESASLEANSGELDIKLRALRREGRLIAGQYSARSRPNLTVRGTHARLSMQRGAAYPFSQGDWEVGLARDIPWNLAISAHLGALEADFQDVNVEIAHLTTGIGDIHTTLGDYVKHGIRLRSTLGNVTVSVPLGVQAVIRVESRPLARVKIDEERFLQVEPGIYATLGYEHADSFVNAEVCTSFGTISLESEQA